MRGKRVVLLSHCCLNQNAVLLGWERAKGPYDFVRILLEEGVGIIQLPCPETLALGIKRPPLEYKDYDTKEHRALCEKLQEETLLMLEAHREVGDEILGVIGIHESPNCSITKQRGIFMEALFNGLEKEGFHLDFLEVPPDYHNEIEGSKETFHKALYQWLQSSNKK